MPNPNCGPVFLSRHARRLPSLPTPRSAQSAARSMPPIPVACAGSASRAQPSPRQIPTGIRRAAHPHRITDLHVSVPTDGGSPAVPSSGKSHAEKDRYGIDVLKVEVPVNMKFVEGTHAYGGQLHKAVRTALPPCDDDHDQGASSILAVKSRVCFAIGSSCRRTGRSLRCR